MKLKLEIGKTYLNGWGDRVKIFHKLESSETTTPYVGVVSDHNFTNEEVETYNEAGESCPGMTSMTLTKGSLITEVSPLVIEPVYEEHA